MMRQDAYTMTFCARVRNLSHLTRHFTGSNSQAHILRCRLLKHVKTKTTTTVNVSIQNPSKSRSKIEKNGPNLRQKVFLRTCQCLSVKGCIPRECTDTTVTFLHSLIGPQEAILKSIAESLSCTMLRHWTMKR